MASRTTPEGKRAGGQKPARGSLVERDARVFLRQSGSTPCVGAIRRAEGIWLEDSAGRRLMDFHGNSVHHLGYGHPKLVAAIKQQLDELPYTPRRYTDEPAVLLAEKLAAMWPGGRGKVLLSTGGSDAIEIALKLARVATARYKTISFYDSYHGSGFGALSVGGRPKDRPARLGPLVPGALHVPPFYRYGGPEAVDAPIWAERSLDAIRFTLRREPDVAALIAEPIRSTPHLPPPWFWPEARKLCDEYGALLIFDEIPTGLGKTGRLFASEHVGATPDMTVLGKALGGGILPIAAVIAKASLDVAPDLALGHYTHEKNPVTARAALATLDIIEAEGLVENALKVGEHTRSHLTEMQGRHSSIRSVRGVGLLNAVELQGRDGTAGAVADRAREKGLNISTTAGVDLTLSPPLVITEREMDQALDILESAIADEERAG